MRPQALLSAVVPVRVWGLGFRVQGFGYRLSGFRVQYLKVQVLGLFCFTWGGGRTDDICSGLGFRISGLGFRASDFGFRGYTWEVGGRMTSCTPEPRVRASLISSMLTLNLCRVSSFGFGVSGFGFEGFRVSSLK